MNLLPNWLMRPVILPMTLMATALAATHSASAATDEEIQAAIDKGKAFLYSKQTAAGRWETDPRRVGSDHAWNNMQGDSYGGFTSAAVYALLASGEDPRDQRIGKAVTFLYNAATHDPEDVIGIYALGLRANIWPFLPEDRRSKIMSQHDASLISQGMQDGSANFLTNGMWDYGNGKGVAGKHDSGRLDHSVSQYGVLGLWACVENGAEVDKSVWKRIDDSWRAQQFPDGGWAYSAAPPGSGEETPSMTAAGVATLFITDDMLNPTRGVDCHGNIANQNIEKGLAWMGTHMEGISGNTYACYGVERIGAASGRRFIGGIDWYQFGAEKIVRSQAANGSWVGSFPGGEPIPATAFALIFLSRGREPTMINKLQYDIASPTAVPGNWNQRPRDLANLTRWVGNRIEHGLQWRTVALASPMSELHDAPILYISGDQSLGFTPEEETKLRDYIVGGGMVVANADCGQSKTQFADSFEKLGQRLFPGAHFRDLTAAHPLFTNQQYPAAIWKSLPRVRGLSNGVREMMVLMPEYDASRAWQVRAEKTGEIAFQLGADLYLYSIDRQHLGEKAKPFFVDANPDIMADRGIQVGRLIVGENWNPEPGGWLRLGAIFHNLYKLDLDAVPVSLDSNRLSRFKILHLTGTNKFELTPAQRQKLTDYVHNGGTLVVDAAGGNPDFADAAASELRACFGSAADQGLAQPLDPASPLFNIPGYKISGVSYRDTYRRKAVGTLNAPRLDGITMDNRLAVFYSREDLSAGMVGQPIDGVAGYTPESATDIMRNIVLYGGFGMGHSKSQ